MYEKQTSPTYIDQNENTDHKLSSGYLSPFPLKRYSYSIVGETDKPHLPQPHYEYRSLTITWILAIAAISVPPTTTIVSDLGVATWTDDGIMCRMVPRTISIAAALIRAASGLELDSGETRKQGHSNAFALKASNGVLRLTVHGVPSWDEPIGIADGAPRYLR